MNVWDLCWWPQQQCDLWVSSEGHSSSALWAPWTQACHCPPASRGRSAAPLSQNWRLDCRSDFKRMLRCFKLKLISSHQCSSFISSSSYFDIPDVKESEFWLSRCLREKLYFERFWPRSHFESPWLPRRLLWLAEPVDPHTEATGLFNLDPVDNLVLFWWGLKVNERLRKSIDF